MRPSSLTLPLKKNMTSLPFLGQLSISKYLLTTPTAAQCGGASNSVRCPEHQLDHDPLSMPIFEFMLASCRAALDPWPLSTTMVVVRRFP